MVCHTCFKIFSVWTPMTRLVEIVSFVLSNQETQQVLQKWCFEFYFRFNFVENASVLEILICSVLPCRHMCLCTDCADVIRHQSNKCPICRQPVQSLLQITKKQVCGFFSQISFVWKEMQDGSFFFEPHPSALSSWRGRRVTALQYLTLFFDNTINLLPILPNHLKLEHFYIIEQYDISILWYHIQNT